MEASQAIAEKVKARLKVRLMELTQANPNGSTGKVNRSTCMDELRRLVRALPTPEFRTLRISRDGEEDRFLRSIIDEGLGTINPLEVLLADNTVSEIMINGPHQIFAEREGRLQPVNAHFDDENHLRATIERLLSSVGVSINESSPVADAMLPDGSRFNAIISPLVVNGPVVTIRRKLRSWSMDEYLARGGMSREAAQFLEGCIKAKANLVISGGTSTGKTTIVSILSTFIPPEERIITIENVQELELIGRKHWIQLVGKNANIEGRGEIPLRALVKNALRMRPDRIIVGEARGGEALDAVQAMHTGHEGFITVLHGSSPQAALERLETMMLMSGVDVPPETCRTQIGNAVDMVIHAARYTDGSRRVASITQVLGTTRDGFQLEDLFVFEPQGFVNGRLEGACRYTGVQPKFLHKFRLNNVEVPAWMSG